MNESTAGRGDPYWYEWFVGLVEVVDMLDPNSDILSVTFQNPGIKGWDDVVVSLHNGQRRCYQVKHTRTEKSITFGDLVGSEESEKSLLNNLFSAWNEGGLNDGKTKCILFTNRIAGSQTYRHRPPLLTFIKWLDNTVTPLHKFNQ